MSSNSAPEPARGSPVRRIDLRLKDLIAAVYPDPRTRPGFAKLAKEIQEKTGGSISGTYLWELATGKKWNVTLEQLDVLAEFFGVPPEYFLNDQVAERVRSQLRLAMALRDAKVRSIALRADGLSTEALKSISEMVDEARKKQQLGPISDDEPAPG
jgi:transcriptional regulator with XRE-family HTH domain